MADKTTQLKNLKDRLEADKSLPLRETATQLVFGDGNPDSIVYFLGEAPGYHEDKIGKPFVGQAGKLLNVVLGEIGLQRESVYISNVVRFRPPENRDPLPEEIAAFAPYVDEEIAIIDPKLIVTLGRFSMGKFFPYDKISKIHGVPKTIKWQGKEIVVIPMYHPAAALRATAILNELKKDFQVIKKILSEIEEENNKPQQLNLI